MRILERILTRSIFLLAIFMTFGLSSCKQSTRNASTPTDDTLNKELVTAAKEAYIFSYPLVMYYQTMYLQALNPKGGVGMNKWLNLGVSSPQDTTIVTPNNDSPYSYAWVDLRAEPYVLTLPKIEAKRFYTSQWNDMYGFVLDNAGSVGDGNDGVRVLLAAPDYSGELPKGVNRIIKGESSILGSLTRTQLIGMKDLPRVKEIQKEYKLEPLSSYLGTEAPSPAPVINWLKWKAGSETKPDFWKYAGFISQFLTKNVADKAKWDALAKFGFKQGEDWEVSKLDKEHKQALLQGQKEALTYLHDLASKPFDPKKFFNPRKGFKNIKHPYEQRALGVMAGIFGNTKNISVYYGFQKDVKGNIPDASKSVYTLTFKAGELPKVNNFWSITMYSLPNRWLVPNELNRYSIGSASTNMKANKDGSLTLYIQPKNPDGEKEGNWLPSPNGPFWIVLRCYGPDESIIKGTWQEPALAPVK